MAITAISRSSFTGFEPFKKLTPPLLLKSDNWFFLVLPYNSLSNIHKSIDN
jgi:hypothetical protein